MFIPHTHWHYMHPKSTGTEFQHSTCWFSIEEVKYYPTFSFDTANIKCKAVKASVLLNCSSSKKIHVIECIFKYIAVANAAFLLRWVLFPLFTLNTNQKIFYKVGTYIHIAKQTPAHVQARFEHVQASAKSLIIII